MLESGINTANTLSVAFSPGEDLRFANTSSQSIFTFGDYRIERSSEPDNITGFTENLSFSPYSTLETLGTNDFNPVFTTSVQRNELKSKSSDPGSYSYFGSFYTEVARSINSIIDSFPYSILSKVDNGVNIYDYSEEFNNTTKEKISKFKITASSLINQGFVAYSSGSTSNDNVSLLSDTNLFEIQLSAYTTAQTIVHKIKTYSFSGGVNPTLEFSIDGYISDSSPVSLTGGSANVAIYIRPSRKVMTQYMRKISRLEKQMLNRAIFDIPDVDQEERNITYRVPWPKKIDGFNPDISGQDFKTYKENMLLLAENVDIAKTNIMIKTMVPDNYLEFDSEDKVYKKLTSAYAKQFDEIKNFIDNIAYAHTITYNEEESVPNKFLIKLSNLLGWKLSSSFSEIDLFEYLSEDSSGGSAFSIYNVEIWKRILVNINWLYKKKGTRDALQFVFKLLGAPDSLIVFNEFVYDITSTVISSGSASTTKSNSRGYINYDSSKYIFQEGGPGRGNGDKYIDQWRPEFDPQKRVNNIKTQVGLSAFTGSENVLNTKEVCATIDPANAIEKDVFDWFKLSGSCWVWGSTGSTFAFSGSAMSEIPYEYQIEKCEFVMPENMSGMTFPEYMDFIYKSNIDPRNRKTNSEVHTSWHYPELRKLYLNYYLQVNPASNKLTFKKLQSFLDLIEVNFQDYLLQLIPATTILDCQGVTYRNTVFNRQRFVYKEGINDGSEFRNLMPPNVDTSTNPLGINGSLNKFHENTLNIVVVNSDVSLGIGTGVNYHSISSSINMNLTPGNVNGYSVNSSPTSSSTIVTIVP